MVTSMKMPVFWNVAPCSLIDVWLITLMLEAVSSSETLVSIYQTTWCNISEYSYLHMELLIIKFSPSCHFIPLRSEYRRGFRVVDLNEICILNCAPIFCMICCFLRNLILKYQTHWCSYNALDLREVPGLNGGPGYQLFWISFLRQILG
jgi:hypothetical protein